MFERLRFFFFMAASGSLFFFQFCLSLRAQSPSVLKNPSWVGRNGVYESATEACESYDVEQQYFMETRNLPNSLNVRCHAWSIAPDAGVAGFVHEGSVDIKPVCASGYKLIHSDTAGGCIKLSWLKGRNPILSGSKLAISANASKTDVIILLPAANYPYRVLNWEPGDVIVLWMDYPFTTTSRSVNDHPSTLIWVAGVHVVTVFGGTRDMVGPYIIKGSELP